VVLRALAKKPAARFQTARELRHALERGARGYADAGVSGLEPTMMAPSSSARRTRSRWIPLAIVAAAALFTGNYVRTKVFRRHRAPSVASEPARKPRVVADNEAPTPAPPHDNPKRPASEPARQSPPETRPAVKREPPAGTKPAPVKRASSAATKPTKPVVKRTSSTGTKHAVKRASSAKTKHAAKKAHAKSKRTAVRKRKR